MVPKLAATEMAADNSQFRGGMRVFSGWFSSCHVGSRCQQCRIGDGYAIQMAKQSCPVYLFRIPGVPQPYPSRRAGIRSRQFNPSLIHLGTSAYGALGSLCTELSEATIIVNTSAAT